MKKKISVGGAYARKKKYEYEGKKYEADLKDGDVITIKSGGELVVGEYGEQHVFSIETRNGDKNISLNQTSRNNLIDAFGEESEEWVGKEAKVFMIRAMVSGKLQNIAYLADKSWIMNDEGQFQGSNVKTDVDLLVDDNAEAQEEYNGL
tara:strand:+ start:694 stop:1140 length:447 start_codon:yes stop_codon:yes gene_type:complete